MHDADVRRTTDGRGLVRDMTLAELRRLDAGRWFAPTYAGERVPTLREILDLCRGKIDVLIDLQEPGEDYCRRITAEVRAHGEPRRIVLGIRNVEHARAFRKLLPEARQLGLLPNPEASTLSRGPVSGRSASGRSGSKKTPAWWRGSAPASSPCT